MKYLIKGTDYAQLRTGNREVGKEEELRIYEMLIYAHKS